LCSIDVEISLEGNAVGCCWRVSLAGIISGIFCSDDGIFHI
jgi:hypothetical protein